MQNNATRRAVDACQRWSDLAIRKQLPLWVWPPDPVNHTSAVDPPCAVCCTCLVRLCVAKGVKRIASQFPSTVACRSIRVRALSPVYGGPEIWAGNVT